MAIYVLLMAAICWLHKHIAAAWLLRFLDENSTVRV